MICRFLMIFLFFFPMDRLTSVNILLTAFSCNRPSEPFHGPPEKTVNVFETSAAAKRGLCIIYMLAVNNVFLTCVRNMRSIWLLKPFENCSPYFAIIGCLVQIHANSLLISLWLCTVGFLLKNSSLIYCDLIVDSLNSSRINCCFYSSGIFLIFFLFSYSYFVL